MGKEKAVGKVGGGAGVRSSSGHKRCVHNREERNCKECGGCVCMCVCVCMRVCVCVCVCASVFSLLIKYRALLKECSTVIIDAAQIVTCVRRVHDSCM